MSRALSIRKPGWTAGVICALACRAALAADGPAPQRTLTYNKDIAPIVYKNCTSCHRPGEVAPFSLITYDDAKRRAKQIANVTESRYMPPWKAEPGYGEFHDARRLSGAEIAAIATWSEQGALEGDAADLPPAPKFPDGWTLGEPDLVLKMPEAFTVPEEGRDVYRCFVIPIPIGEDEYVAAIDFRPSNRKVVHHAILFLDSSGAARKKDAADPAPGYHSFAGPGIIPTGGLGGWAPGAFPRRLPEGIGKPLKKGSDLVLQLHLHPSGKPEVEQSTVGLYFCKKKPEKNLAALPLRSRDIDIPPGEKNYKIRSSFTTPVDLQAVGITPHAHLICKEMKGDAILPDGSKKPLIWIKDWDFNWQDQYLYAQPIKLPKGTRLEMEFTYDNSSENVRNPSDPPQRVRFGEQTADEMAILFIQVVADKPLDLLKLRTAMIQDAVKGALGGGKRWESLRDLAARFDKDGDGVLSDEERDEALDALKKNAK